MSEIDLHDVKDLAPHGLGLGDAAGEPRLRLSVWPPTSFQIVSHLRPSPVENFGYHPGSLGLRALSMRRGDDAEYAFACTMISLWEGARA
jgi:hypothetical protein